MLAKYLDWKKHFKTTCYVLKVKMANFVLLPEFFPVMNSMSVTLTFEA